MPAETILIVDDDPICLCLASHALRQAGFTTQTARDGVEALDLLQTLLPDLILSDIQMPNMDGFELARRTRQLPRLCDIPLIALSALARPDAQQRAYEAGFTAYLAKPVAGAKLTCEVRRHLDRRSNSSTAA
ncbi:MAG: response regulator receiver protein [Candidatus Solibacter sp.]|nr:response regulator receiver protein [Candidatus Solibacter sp.]